MPLGVCWTRFFTLLSVGLFQLLYAPLFWGDIPRYLVTFPNFLLLFLIKEPSPSVAPFAGIRLLASDSDSLWSHTEWCWALDGQLRIWIPDTSGSWFLLFSYSCFQVVTGCVYVISHKHTERRWGFIQCFFGISVSLFIDTCSVGPYPSHPLIIWS